MPLHPQAQAMRDERARAGTPQLYTLTVAQARIADLASIVAGAGTPEPVHQVVEREIPGPGSALPVRIYRPDAAGALPTLVYFFGGGWVLGNLDTSDAICRSLANAAGVQVVAVGYRLAPEHPFPAAVHDCYAGTEWVAGHAAELGVDLGKLVVGGDSAGGNLAAVVALLARDRGGPALAGQVLVYPVTDHAAADGSMVDNADPWLFNRTSMRWYWSHYLTAPEQGTDPLASPAVAADLSGLPPALVITAEYDPLRDQGEGYAGRLADAGVPVSLTRYDGMVHGFFAMPGVLDAGGEAQRQVAAWLRTLG